MNNADSNEQFGSDSEQRKADVHRAKDIIPPLKAPAGPAPATQQPGQKVSPPPAVPPSSPDKGLSPGSVQLPKPGPKPAADTPAAPLSEEQVKSEVPRFDLAEKIMAEQRRITAIRRKGPSQIEEAQELEAESGSNTEEQVPPALLEEEQIIAEIVARDIERLCRGRISGIPA